MDEGAFKIVKVIDPQSVAARQKPLVSRQCAEPLFDSRGAGPDEVLQDSSQNMNIGAPGMIAMTLQLVQGC